MTTVAFDGKVMAADSLQVGPWKCQTPCQKVFRDIGRFALLGFAGTRSDIDPIIEWIERGMSGDEVPDFSEISCLAVDREAKTWLFDHSPSPFLLDEPTAIGSGSVFAMGALLSGLNAQQAVEIAAKLDIYTGGEIVVYPLRQEVEQE